MRENPSFLPTRKENPYTEATAIFSTHADQSAFKTSLTQSIILYFEPTTLYKDDHSLHV